LPSYRNPPGGPGIVSTHASSASAGHLVRGYLLVDLLCRRDALDARRVSRRSEQGRGVIRSHWQEGLVYMLAVIGILLMHEMGHFLQTVRNHSPPRCRFSSPFRLP